MSINDLLEYIKITPPPPRFIETEPEEEEPKESGTGSGGEAKRTGVGAILDYLAMTAKDVVDPDHKPKRSFDREQRRIACGKKFSYRLQVDGGYKKLVQTCQDYRLCPPCQLKYCTEMLAGYAYHQNQLAFGQRLKSLIMDDEKWPAFRKKISRREGEYSRIPQPDEKSLIIHNLKDLPGEIVWDIDYEGEDLDVCLKEVVSKVPEESRITGELHTKPKDKDGKNFGGKSDDGEGEEDDPQIEIRLPSLYSQTITEREFHLAFMEAVKQTQNISCLTNKELENALFRRAGVWKTELEKLGKGVVTLFHTYHFIKESEIFSWNNNPNNGVDFKQENKK